MNLYILRHGIAADRDSRKYPDDGDRPLTRKGIDKMTRQVAGMNALAISPDVIITSPLVRAAQTAEIVRRGLTAPPQTATSDALVPWSHPSRLLQELTANYPSASSIMLVGHEPHLSCLVSLILIGDILALIKLKKGALCHLKISPSRRGRLLWALTPNQLTKLAQPNRPPPPRHT